MYSLKSVKQIFNKVAHSSNRKLDKRAMQTLIDLMVMAFKYQVKMVVQNEEIYFVTTKHLEVMQKIIEGSTSVNFITVAR